MLVCVCVCVREREERERTSKVSRDMKGFMVYIGFVIVVRMIGGCERNTFIYIYIYKTRTSLYNLLSSEFFTVFELHFV